MFLRSNKVLRSNSGTAINELALILPVFMVIFGTMFELSRIYYIQSSLEYGAKQAARIGSSVKESVDSNYVSNTTLNRTELETLITNSVRISGVIQEAGQFAIKYFNSAGTEIAPVADLPFDRVNDPNAIDYVQVEISYPGTGAGVNAPIPVVFNPGNVFNNTITLKAKAIYKIEGRIEN